MFRNDGLTERVLTCQALCPGREAFIEDVAIEELVGVGTAIVPSPAIGV
jgi:hypothetical protein